MQSRTVGAQRPCAQTSARSDLIEKRLRRYCPRFQERVCVLANCHPRLAELSVSFPAALFAMAVPRSEVDPERAIAGAISGASLREVAAAAGIPLWLRKLPVEAFAQPIPRLPDGDLFRRQIANHLPRSPKLAPTWLSAVANAATWAHELLAVWVARELMHDSKSVKLSRLQLISLFAWFSHHPDTIGHRMIGQRWHPGMRFRTALDAAHDWRMRLALHINLGNQPIPDMWLGPGSVAGYDFVPLRTAESIAEEAAAMKNCLCSYGYNVAHNRSRLWAVRNNGQRIATLKVAAGRRDPLLTIEELEAANNTRASAEIWWIARQWLNSHDLPQINTNRLRWDTAPLDRSAWRVLWQPYWLAKRRIPPWLPMAPSRATLGEL